jgi:dipeptidyl aminopeptidase/acylaminoacyl peptidase
VTAPTLVLHGGEDHRCPVNQGERWFAALRAQRVPTRLVIYPGGAHGFVMSGPPSHRADYNSRLVDWLEQHMPELP